MYYKSVNRGLTFTKPGMYAIMFVMAIGMLAIISGVNGLYLFLSSGLAALIVSGMLSERTIKAFAVKKIAVGVFEAGKPQHVKLIVTNRSNRFFLHGVEAFVVHRQPRFRLLKRDPEAMMQVRVQRLAPGEQSTVNAITLELPRCYFREFIIYYRTEYPFGLLEKFKITQLDANVVVAPQVNERVFQDVHDLVQNHVRRNDDEQEFYSHRSYMPRDSLKFVDWRRSANRPTSAWVVKRFTAEQQNNRIIVVMDWALLQAAETEVGYEQEISRLYSVVKAVHQVIRGSGYRFGLSLDGVQVLWDFDAIVRELADLPEYHKRPVESPVGGELMPDNCLILRVGQSSVQMESQERSA